MGGDEVSQQVVEQRMRNRIIEYLDDVAEYENDPPWWDLNEMINQWEDYVVHPLDPAKYTVPVYTDREAEALVAVDNAWLAFADATPDAISDEAAALRMREWRAFVSAAETAMKVFSERGRLSEDVECG
jgi:hypothetical protein